MDLKKLMAEAQKMQKELATTLEAYDKKEFEFDYKGLVSVKIMGSLEIKDVKIKDHSIVDKSDVDTLQDIIVKAVNDAIDCVLKGKNELTSKIAGPGIGNLM